MDLEDLLQGNEKTIAEWLSEKDLIHECDCGYTVYDPDDVNSAVQDKWGSERCDEIHEWACQLSNRFGWLFIESARSESRIYHCQYCDESELSLLYDLEKIASANSDADSGPNQASPPTVDGPKPGERLIVYIDESYSEEFPRKPSGSFAYAALILPESQIATMESAVKQILLESYRGTPANELKYNKIAKREGLLERVGSRVVNLLARIPDVKVIGIFVPQSGFFGEKRRSIEAEAYYRKSKAKDSDLEEVLSTDSIEGAVVTAANDLAHLIAVCVSNYVASHGAFATIVFDPRSKRLDEALLSVLRDFLPSTPINVPQLAHGKAIVTLWPKEGTETVGKRVTCELIQSSHESPGLQLADFLAGDIRAFFTDANELLDEVTSEKPLVNRRVLFPEIFHVQRISGNALEKVKNRTGKSFLPLYRHKLVNSLISYYTSNGQMRNLNAENGSVFDLMD